MRGFRGFLTGALALIVLEVVLTNRQATGRVTGFFSGVAAATNWLIDTGTPGIPDRSAPSSTSSAAQSLPGALIAAPATASTTAAYSTASTLA